MHLGTVSLCVVGLKLIEQPIGNRFQLLTSPLSRSLGLGVLNSQSLEFSSGGGPSLNGHKWASNTKRGAVKLVI